ncbi:MAG: peptidoglycan DD-metalloendopeptidase family protein, partial [Bacteroidales bacterium]|nr:peptidoglycan DD-metalloendopeptidase family protein [Bacteroidales bacterium]
LTIFLAGGDLYAQTKEIENQKEKIKKLEADISYLDNQILATQKKKKNTLDELVLVQRKVSNRKKLLAELDAEIKTQTKEIAQVQRNITLLGKRLDTLEHYYRNMVYNAYKHRDTKLWFMYILASENFDQGYRRWSYLKNYSKTISSQAEKIRELKEERSAELKKLEKMKEANIARQKARKKEYDKLAAEERQQRAFAKSLDKKQSQYRSQLTKKRQEANRLAKEVERMIAAEIRRQQELARMAQKNKQQTDNKQAQQQNDIGRLEFEEYAANTKLSGSFSLNKGKLPFPVAQGVIVEQFGVHPHPTLKNVKLPFNNGINISTKPGSSVKAVFDGVVKQVIAIPGYNQCVLVQHGQYFTFYCKLSKVGVKVGDKVSTGEAIGNLESGGSTATLHFELWNGTNKQNPELWLKK